MSSGPRSGGEPPEQLSCTEDRVVDAVLAVLDEGGAGALTVEAVAGRLGVDPGALACDRSGLERAAIERVLSTVRLGPLYDPGVEWVSAVIQLALSMRSRLWEHPAVAVLMMSGPHDGPADDGPAARDIEEALFACFARGGLHTQMRAHGVYAVLVYVLGSTALDIAETDGRPPLPPDSERIERRRAQLRDLDVDRWTRTAAHVDEIAAWTSVDQFVWGLRVLLVGMTAS
ncbi:TetR/AcrR family transcriptional regulator [Nocardia caishijiensis]|uniref:TetR/AcrR family transcriptional regulator n=1 Tax=Nocardia caishijiensis TaxID=184756 RepID=UPI0009FDD397|nr:TetR/AcrR family transcriptional regulator C-terminal domain-containing protein [Nocardia caishijiensis]